MEEIAQDKQVTPFKVDRWQVDEVTLRPALAEAFIGICKGHDADGKLVTVTRDNLTLRDADFTAFVTALQTVGVNASVKAAFKLRGRI